MKLFVGTWNMGGLPPPIDIADNINIKEWLFPFNEKFVPDLVVIGF